MSDEQIADDDENSEGEAPIAIATSLEYSKWVNTGPSRLETIEGYRTAIAMAREEGAESELLRELMRKDLFFLLIYGLGGNTYANNDWVFDRCREFQESSTGYIDLWPRFHFKGVPNSFPVKELGRGWVGHGELRPGDHVFAPDGRPVRVQAITEVFDAPPCFEVRLQSGAVIPCTRDHEWRVKRKAKGPRPLRHMEYWEEIVEVQDLRPGDNVGSIEGPLQYDRKPVLDIDPYVLGVWLGDGDSINPYFTKHKCDIEIIEDIRARGYVVEELSSGGKNTSKWAIRCDASLVPFRKRLGALGVINNKHVPMEYLDASAASRFDLLAGLMDTDGHSDGRGTANFATKRRPLADTVLELARSLGLRPHLQVIQTTINGEPYESYRVAFQHYTGTPVFHLARKQKKAVAPTLRRYTDTVVSVTPIPSVPSRCIQVEGGMYLVGKELIPTHNSTIITLAAAIQRILNDPEITIGIFSYNRPTAKVFLRAIKTQFESNEKLKELFPDILWGDPSKEAPKWSEDDGIVVRRNGFPKEMTVEASGLVDSMPTGRHYKLRIYDDVVVPASVSSPEMIEKTTEAIELSFNLGTIDGEDEQWMVGTVYNRADTNQRLIARGAVKPRVYAATKDGTLDGEPWVMKPALLRKKIKEMGSYVASCQLFNKPVLEGEETFSPEWVQYWRPDRLDRLNLYMLIDPANSKTKKSDYTVIIIMGLGPDHNYYLVDGIRDKLSIRERTARVMAMHAQYRPLIVGYEKYGIQTDIEFLEEMQAKEQYRFRVEPLGGSMSKEDRIRRLQPLFESRRVYLPEKLIRVNYQGRQYDFTQVFLQNEYLQFPYMVHDDMLDCMARITDEALKAHFPQGTMLKPGATMLEEQTDEAYAFDTYSY